MTDTIVAISSALAPGLRGVIRLSGPQAFAIVAPYYRPATPLPTYGRSQGQFLLPSWQTSIEVVLYLMKAPHSYTTEDMVEIHTWSAPILLQYLVQMLIQSGARPAAPGEFTRRAFNAGRIDLAQAEAVAALIDAATEAERRSALLGLAGELSRRLNLVRDRLTQVIALLESYIDFMEEEVGTPPQHEIMGILQEVVDTLAQLTSGATMTGAAAVTVCLCGLANSGKSSFFNSLIGEELSITSPVAGTTLDYLEGNITIAEQSFKIIDTPGIIAQAQGVQALAQQKAGVWRAGADILLYLIDGSVPFSDQHEEIRKTLPPVPTLCLKTKRDLPSAWGNELLEKRWPQAELLEVSILNPASITAVKERLALYACHHEKLEEPTLLSARQHYVARECVELVRQGLSQFAQGISYEFVVIDLRAALNLVGELTGTVTTEDILTQIFTKFCIGK